MLSGVDHMIITFMALIIKTIVVFISFHVVGVYLGHLQLMRCVWNVIINVSFLVLLRKYKCYMLFIRDCKHNFLTYLLIVQVLFVLGIMYFFYDYSFLFFNSFFPYFILFPFSSFFILYMCVCVHMYCY